MSESTLTFAGGAIKALGDQGTIGGFGVLFSGPDDPDLDNEFFTKETDYDLEDRRSVRLLYSHGLDKTVGSKQLARASFEFQEKGIWFEATLDRNDATQSQVYDLVKQNQFGFSSGSVSHLVRTRPAGRAKEILAWPLSELSVTPRPVEPRARAMALKSFAAEEFELAYLVNPLQKRIDAAKVKFEALQRQSMAGWGTEQTARAEAYAAERARQARAEQEGARMHAEITAMQTMQNLRTIRENKAQAAEIDYQLTVSSGPGRARGHGSLRK
jgi:HK97 family phage prohead protease